MKSGMDIDHTHTNNYKCDDRAIFGGCVQQI
jgi:hypothetical protein